VTVVVASLTVERSTGGAGVFDLFEEIRSRFIGNSGLLLHLDKTISLCLGTDWSRADEARFDVHIAADSLRFYDSLAIPSVAVPPPPEVTEVTFKADLTNIIPVDRDFLIRSGNIFSAVVATPRR